MSSEEEIHMLPSFVKVYPLTCRPQSGLVLFPALPAELSQENGKRGSNGEKEMLGIFWRTGSK